MLSADEILKEIAIRNTSDRPYWENSTHLDVQKCCVLMHFFRHRFQTESDAKAPDNLNQFSKAIGQADSGPSKWKERGIKPPTRKLILNAYSISETYHSAFWSLS